MDNKPWRFFRKLLLFIIIPMIISIIVSLSIPPDIFTFRAWETLVTFRVPFVGPFYPNHTLYMEEPGDLGVHTEFAILRDIVFITDSYGYRYDATDIPSIVIVGDSMTTGSSLTQDDTLAPVLSRMLNQSVYPFAPADIRALLQDDRFSDPLPSILILQIVERSIDDRLCPQSFPPASRIQIPSAFQQNPLSSWLLVEIDQAMRLPSYFSSFLKSRTSDDTIIVNDSGLLFFDESIYPPEWTAESILDIAGSLRRCYDWFTDQGTQFIVLPIPDKETIYYDTIPPEWRTELPVDERDQFLRLLISELQAQGVPVVDTLTAFQQSRENGVMMYQFDDTHWNSEGVRITAGLLNDIIEQVISP